MATGSHVHYVINGTIDTSQTWSTRITAKVNGSASIDSVTLGVWLDDLASDFSTLCTDSTAGLKQLVSLNGTIENSVGYWFPDTSAPAGAVGVATARIGAGSNAMVNPPQVACVASLLTPLTGRNNRGRMYLPYWGLAASSGRVNPTVGAALAPLVAAFLSAIQASTVSGNPLSVSTATTGAQITQVSIDDVLDTQRRRRDKVAATNTWSHLVTT